MRALNTGSPLLPSQVPASTAGDPPLSASAHRPSGTAFTEREFRDALGEFATGVTIIAARGPDDCWTGFTANSFNSVSLAPPLVVWSLNRRATNLAAFEAAACYSVNVLAHDQQALAERFAAPIDDRFAGVAFGVSERGLPRIDGCIAWFECRHFRVERTGDHLLFIGEVLQCGRKGGPALLFHRGRFGHTGRG